MKQLLILTFFLGFSLSVIAQPYKDVYDLYKQRKFDKAIKLGTEYLQKDSTSGLLNMYVGGSYYYKGSYREAIPYLKKGASCTNCDSWVKAWSMVDLGSCYFMVDDYTMAKTMLRACLKPNATPMEIPKAKKSATKLLKSFALTENYDSWTIMETEHFRFHIQDTSILKGVKYYIGSREEKYVIINKFFIANPVKKIDFYVWSSTDSMMSEFGHDSPIHITRGCIFHSLYKRKNGRDIAHILYKLGIAPEVESKLISEGTEFYFDQTGWDRMAIAKTAVAGSDIHIVDIWKTPEKISRETLLKVGGAFVEFLVKNGTTDQLKQLLKNQSIKNAKKVYANFDALVAQFEKELYCL